jgi:cysteine synthase
MRRLVEELGPGRNVVTVLPDTGERYFSLSGRLQDPA